MNRIERRVRDMINPYSTAFASWWCHSARHMRLPRMTTGSTTAARPGLPWPAVHRMHVGPLEDCASHSSPSTVQALTPGERAPCQGSAQPTACDATAESELDTVTAS
jgi:hypothetical protein